MSIVPNIPIARKFLLAFGLICLSCIALGVFTFIAFRSIAAKSAAVGADDFPSVV
jgi:CHASE3 domain sensor protein